MASNPNFGATTEASEVLAAFPDSVRGKTILITGVGPTGLGATLAELLATHGAKILILSGRTESRLKMTADKIVKANPTVEVRTVQLDVSSFRSVAQGVQVINNHAEPDHIDIVFNNAAVMNVPDRQLSADGFELHLATNFLGPAVLTNSILAKLKASPTGGRIVNIASDGYRLSPFRFSAYNFDGQDELAEEEKPIKATSRLKDTNVTVSCVNPGVISTEIWRLMKPEKVHRIVDTLPPKSSTQGASTALVAALDPKLKENSGAYLEDCQVADVLPFAKDKSKAEKLWDLAEKLTGQRLASRWAI